MFEGDLRNHLATALIGGELVQHFLAAIHDADPHRGVHLVAREAVEIASQGLYVNRKMRYCLCAIDKDGYSVGMSDVDNFFDGVDGAQSVGDMVDSHDTGLVGERWL